MFKKTNQKIKIIFMGSSQFSSIVLRELINADYDISTVVTQPDKKVGRLQEIKINPVKKLAQIKNIPVWQPKKLDDNLAKKLKELAPDVAIVVAYGKILSEKILDIPKFKSLNIHASLLPKLRGPSPIQNAILQGHKITGVTIMLMNEGIDTGDILGYKKIKITTADKLPTLSKKLANAGALLLLKILPLWIKGRIEPQEQNENKATLCQLIEKEDGKILWNKTAEEIYNQFKALYPWPGIYSFWDNKKNLQRIIFKDISFEINNHREHRLGEVFLKASKLSIQTERGIIVVNSIQLAGKKEQSAQEFINGYPKFIGAILK